MIVIVTGWTSEWADKYQDWEINISCKKHMYTFKMIILYNKKLYMTKGITSSQKWYPILSNNIQDIVYSGVTEVPNRFYISSYMVSVI